MKLLKTFPGDKSRTELSKCETLEEKKYSLQFSPTFKEWVKEEELEDWHCFILEEIPCYMGDDVTYFINTKLNLYIESFDDCPRVKDFSSTELKDIDKIIMEFL